MSQQHTWKRIRERLELKLPVRVVCRETPDFEWMEVTRLINVTPFGCGFTLKRPTESGRILHMTIPMPRQLRVFDHAEDQYRVWALVRYARRLNHPIRPQLYSIVASPLSANDLRRVTSRNLGSVTTFQRLLFRRWLLRKR